MGRPPLDIGAHGVVAVTKLGAKRFVARTRTRGEDGVVRRVEAAGTSGADARRRLDRSLKRQPDAAGEITGATRLAVVVERWVREEVEGSTRSANTIQRYREIAANYVVPRAGALLVRESTVPRLERLVREVSTDVGPPTAKLVRTVLTGALGLAVRHGALPVNPVREVSPIRSPRREVVAPTLDDVVAIRADLAADAKACRADLPVLVDVLAGTGARIGEALALRWVDVDLGTGVVALTGTAVRVRIGDDPGVLVRQDTTKGRKPRAMRVPPFTLDALRTQHERKLPGGEHGVVFPSATGTLREVATVERQWRGFRTRNPRWSGVTFHAFRRAVATAVERDAGMATASAVLGHSGERVTAQHYVQRAMIGPDVSAVLQRFAGATAE